MNKKIKPKTVKIIKLIILIIIILLLIYTLIWYLDKKDHINKLEGKLFSYDDYDDYEDYVDPCFHEPGTPDPCGGG